MQKILNRVSKGSMLKRLTIVNQVSNLINMIAVILKILKLEVDYRISSKLLPNTFER